MRRKLTRITVTSLVFTVTPFVLVACAQTSATTSPSSQAPATNAPSSSDSGERTTSEPHYTVSQEQAIKSAEQYLSTTAFSRAGLIEQLSSSAGSGFAEKDAIFAVDHLHVNWDEQAVKAAKQYLSTSSFSCQGLTEQLTSSAGSKFTQAQAEYAATKVGLC